ncbi:hypothetical protein BH09PSE6_BH09PSE6_22070 [soil metagenome]
MSPILLLFSIYAVIFRLLWPILSPLSMAVLGLGAAYSLLAIFWIIQNINAAAGGRGRTIADRARDLAIPLGGAAIVPAPYMAGALALVWMFEDRHNAAIWSAGVAIVVALVQYAVFRWMRGQIKNLPDISDPSDG